MSLHIVIWNDMIWYDDVFGQKVLNVWIFLN